MFGLFFQPLPAHLYVNLSIWSRFSESWFEAYLVNCFGSVNS